MRNVLSLLLTLGFFVEFLHGQEQFHRAVVRPRKRMKRLRLHRQTFEEPISHRYAAEAVKDALQNEQGSQLLVQHLASQFYRSGQTQKQPNSPVQKDVSELAPKGLMFVDQYGRLVSENPNAQADQHVVIPNVKYLHQLGSNVESPLQLSQPQIHGQHQPRFEVLSQERPNVRSHVLQQIPTHLAHQIKFVNQYGPESESSNIPQQEVGLQYAFPALQQVFNPHDIVLQQEPLLIQQAIHGAGPDFPQVFQVPFQLRPAFPQQVIQPQFTGQLQVAPQPEQHLQPQVAYVDAAQSPLVPQVKKIVAPPTIVKKAIVPNAVVKVVPEVHLIKQPVLPPAVFQKQIFALKNPPVRVLTYSDLCTVYPYQRKLAGCVLKKSVIPELHHPDIQQVSEQRTSATNVAETETNKKQADHSTTGGMENIQAILGPSEKGDTGSFLPLDEEGVELSVIQSDASEQAKNDNVSVAASSNKNVNRIVVASKVSKALVAAKTTSAPVTTSSTPASIRSTKTTTTTTRKPKTKGRNSGGSKRTTSNGGRRNGRTGSRKSRSTTTTTETPFKLA